MDTEFLRSDAVVAKPASFASYLSADPKKVKVGSALTNRMEERRRCGRKGFKAKGRRERKVRLERKAGIPQLGPTLILNLSALSKLIDDERWESFRIRNSQPEKAQGRHSSFVQSWFVSYDLCHLPHYTHRPARYRLWMNFCLDAKYRFQ